MCAHTITVAEHTTSQDDPSMATRFVRNAAALVGVCIQAEPPSVGWHAYMPWLGSKVDADTDQSHASALKHATARFDRDAVRYLAFIERVCIQI